MAVRIGFVVLPLALAGCAPSAPPPVSAEGSTLTPVELVATFDGAMPTGVAVSPSGRVFVNFPQWGDGSPVAVGEVTRSGVVAYPDKRWNTAEGANPAERLVSVQSVVADGANRLWILDTGAPGFRPPIAGGAKLVVVDLATNEVVRTIGFTPDVVLPTTYLNDLRLDLRGGGTAYLTDSSVTGEGGIIVVDLATGKARRRLSGHPSTMPDPGFTATIEGEVVATRPKNGPATPWLVASDGIAISADGSTLYYCALSSRHFHAVPTALLRDPVATDTVIAAKIVDLGPKAPSDGLAEDAEGRLYAGDVEQGTIRRFAKGAWTTIADDSRILWPDSLAVSTDGYLYFTSNQLHRQAAFHEGIDHRLRPYALLRVRIGAGPVLLR